jgi:phosphoribosylaminoimidazole-succinocarboxamide synthase
MDIVEKLEMIKDLWDMGMTQNIEKFVVEWNKKHEDTTIEFVHDEDGNIVLSDLQKLFVAREIADNILDTPL